MQRRWLTSWLVNWPLGISLVGLLAHQATDLILRLPPPPPAVAHARGGDSGRYTVRVNTYQRPALLSRVTRHFARCPRCAEIDIVWSEPDVPPPEPAALLPPRGAAVVDGRRAALPPRLHVERHTTGSLNNRFAELAPTVPGAPPPTAAVFSVDDDVLISCADVERAFDVWRAAPAALVGFEPRALDRGGGTGVSGRWGYAPWQQVRQSGGYDLVLTKVGQREKARAHARTHARTHVRSRGCGGGRGVARARARA